MGVGGCKEGKWETREGFEKDWVESFLDWHDILERFAKYQKDSFSQSW